MSERFNILLGCPSNGTAHDGASRARWLASSNHQVNVVMSQNSGGNLNRLLAAALNEGRRGEYTHFAMICADIIPRENPRWLDVLVDEMERLDADLISTVVAIKDPRGVTSSGIGDPNTPWCPFRRLTINELPKLPDTFTAADIDPRCADYPLLHNIHLWVMDLRKPVWQKALENHEAPAFFRFVESVKLSPDTMIRMNDGREIRATSTHEIGGEVKAVVNGAEMILSRAEIKDITAGIWDHFIDSEDWNFSRRLHAMGAKTFVTQKVKCDHPGSIPFPNHGAWGQYQNGDEDTARNWRVEQPVTA